MHIIFISVSLSLPRSRSLLTSSLSQPQKPTNPSLSISFTLCDEKLGLGFDSDQYGHHFSTITRTCFSLSTNYS